MKVSKDRLTIISQSFQARGAKAKFQVEFLLAEFLVVRSVLYYKLSYEKHRFRSVSLFSDSLLICGSIGLTSFISYRAWFSLVGPCSVLIVSGFIPLGSVPA